MMPLLRMVKGSGFCLVVYLHICVSIECTFLLKKRQHIHRKVHKSCVRLRQFSLSEFIHETKRPNTARLQKPPFKPHSVTNHPRVTTFLISDTIDSFSLVLNFIEMEAYVLCIYLFGCFKSQLLHVGSLVAGCGLLFPDLGLNPGSLHGELESQPLDCMGSPQKHMLYDLCLVLFVQYYVGEIHRSCCL